jgi:hypothetical protein
MMRIMNVFLIYFWEFCYFIWQLVIMYFELVIRSKIDLSWDKLIKS